MPAAQGAQMLLGSSWGSPLVFLMAASASECAADKSYSRCRASAENPRTRGLMLHKAPSMAVITSGNPPLKNLYKRNSADDVSGRMQRRRADHASLIHPLPRWMKTASATRPAPPYIALVARMQSGGCFMSAINAPDSIRATNYGARLQPYLVFVVAAGRPIAAAQQAVALHLFVEGAARQLQ